MSFSVLLSSYLLVVGTICVVIYAFTKHFFPRQYKKLSLFTTVFLVCFGFFLLSKVEYFPSQQHLAYYRELQDASDAKLTSKETLIFLDGCQFRLEYKDDPNIVYLYRYTIGEGMRCTVKSTTGGSAYLNMRYPPRSGYVTLP